VHHGVTPDWEQAIKAGQVASRFVLARATACAASVFKRGARNIRRRGVSAGEGCHARRAFPLLRPISTDQRGPSLSNAVHQRVIETGNDENRSAARRGNTGFAVPAASAGRLTTETVLAPRLRS